MKRYIKLMLIMVVLVSGSVLAEGLEREQWAFVHKKFVEEPEKTWSSFASRHVGLLSFGSAATVFGVTNFFGASNYADFCSCMRGVGQAFYKVFEIGNDTCKIVELEKKPIIKDAEAKNISFDEKERDKKKEVEIKTISTEKNENALVEIPLSKNLIAKCEGFKEFAEKVRNSLAGSFSRAAKQYVGSTIISGATLIGVYCVIKYANARLYDQVFKEYVENWNEYRNQTPKILQERFERIYNEYKTSTDPDKYLKKEIFVSDIITLSLAHEKFFAQTN